MKSTSWSVLVAVVAISLSVIYWMGCSDDRSESVTNPVLTQKASPDPAVNEGTFDDLLADVARRVPGFGGVAVGQDGALELILVDATQAQAAREALASVFGEESVAERAVRVRQGQYSFLDLKTWHDVLSPEVLAMKGAVFTDADENANRVRIGISDPSTRKIIDEQLKNHSIPKNAVVVETVDPIENVSLQAKHRPLVGGLQINFGPTNNFLCSLGLIVNRAGLRGLLTASHCSNTQGGIEGTVHHQHLASGTTNRVSLEVADPLYTLGGTCPAGRCCRNSDASFHRVPHTSGPATTSTLGRIARPALNSFAWNGVDLFTILGKQVPTFIGESVTRVGRSSGRRVQTVNATCINTNVGGALAKCTDGIKRPITLRCQSRAGGGMAPIGGDSGSPIFRFVAGNNVAVNGIVWGTDGVNGYFSTIDRIDSELGALTVN